MSCNVPDLFRTFNLMPNMATFQDWPLMIPMGSCSRWPPFRDWLEPGGEWDPFKSYNVTDLFKTFDLIPNRDTFKVDPLWPQWGSGSGWQTDRQTCPIRMGSLFIVNNYSKSEVNIFSKDRDIRKRLILSKNSKCKKGHNYVKKHLRVTCPTSMGFPFDSKQ